MKNNINKIILIIIFFIISIFIGIVAYMYTHPNISVLCYHNLATKEEKENFPDEIDWTIDVENFKEHLEYLKRNKYKTLTMEEFIQWKKGEKKLPYKSVLITFDDGFLSNYHYAFPLLKEYNMNATVFIAGSFVENSRETEWTGNIKTYMSKEIIDRMETEFPNIDICSHSYNLHYPGAIQQEKQELINDVNKYNLIYNETDVYCYPFGQYNENMKNALKEKNYKIAFRYGPESKDYKKANKNDDDYEIPRLNVSHGMNVTKFGLRLLMYK